MSTPTIRTTGYRPNAKYVLLLGLMTALPAITSDMYLPSLPEVARQLSTTETSVQLTMTFVLIGAAFGQLVVGPLSDVHGRRRPVLIGIALHVATSLACAVAPNIGSLIALRTLQGFFNASAAVVAMAVIRDRFVGSDASRLLSRLMLVIGVAPLFAPTIGGAVAHQWGWRAVFVFLALYGVALWVLVWLRLPETLAVGRRRSAGLRSALAGYRLLLRDRQFIAYGMLPGLSFVVIMCYVVGSPFVLRVTYGLTATQFALIFAANGTALIGFAQLNAALVRRYAPARILRVAVPWLTITSAALFVVALTGAGGLPGLLAALWLVLGPVQLINPNATVLALGRHGAMAGTAAAFLGAANAAIAGSISPLVGVFGSDARAMAGVIFGSVLLLAVILVTASPVYRRGGWEA